MTQFFQSSRKIPVYMTYIFYCERHKSRFLGALVVYRNWLHDFSLFLYPIPYDLPFC